MSKLVFFLLFHIFFDFPQIPPKIQNILALNKKTLSNLTQPLITNSTSQVQVSNRSLSLIFVYIYHKIVRDF